MAEYLNPLVCQRADPYCYKHTDGYYYFTATVPDYAYIELRRAKNLNYLGSANAKIIWQKHDTGEMGAHIWAPEIYYIDNKWYIYFSAGSAEEPWEIRPYALVCEDEDPLTGHWVEAGKIDVGVQTFSLDMTIFFHKGRQYAIWAQTKSQNENSSLYLAEMETPTKLKSKPLLLTTPEYEWENCGIPVNEGPAALIRNGKIFITYSASDTGANYCMGLLWCSEDDDVLDINSWHKMKEPVFKTCEENSQYGPGHNSFTTDNGQDVLVFHSRNYKGIVGDPLDDINRHARAQTFTYDENGFPVFGVPLEDNVKDE